MSIPIAVAPTVLGPGVYLTVDLLASEATPGTQPLKAVIMAPKSTAGTLTPDTEVRRAGSAGDGNIAFGPGSPGALALARFLEKNPTAVVDMIAPTASAGASASASVTFAGTVTMAYNVEWKIAGRVINVPWNAGELPADIQARSIAAINAQTNNLPASASAGATGVVVLTFKVPGPWGNDCLYAVALQGGTGGTVGGAAAVSGALTGGVTEPDFSTALGTLSGTKYDFFIPCFSNADAQSSSATSNPGRLKSKINSLNTGLNAKLQQAIIGLSGTLTAAKTGAIARNEPTFEYIECIAGQSLPCEWAAAEAGDRMARVAIKPSANRIGRKLENCFGAADLVANTPTAAQIEDALGNGVSIVSYNAQGEPIIVRPVTTHSQDALGNADRRVFDVSQVDGTYAVANDIEVALPQEFPEANVIKDQAAGDEPPPEDTVEEKDIKTFIISRLRFWQRRGVIRRDLLEEAIANGSIIVQVNAIDPTQVDIVIPIAIVPPLAKFGVYIQKIA